MRQVGLAALSREIPRCRDVNAGLIDCRKTALRRRTHQLLLLRFGGRGGRGLGHGLLRRLA